jgi:hypothetical protein
MSEYTAPYKVEGFDNPTMQTVFKDLLMVKKSHRRKRSDTNTKVTGSNGETCTPSSKSGQQPLTMSSNTGSSEQMSFLKTLIVQQKESVDSLINTAKRISPIANTVYQKEEAYDAAFESNPPASLPKVSGTLQGFAIYFFLFSFIAFALTSTIVINMVTQSGFKAAMAFIGFVVFGFVVFGIVTRYA